MRGPPVVLTPTLGRPVTNIISERGAVPMTVVNTLGEPVTLVASGGEPVTLFNPNGTLWDYPFSLFSNNEQGAWYDPSDFSTLFQNAAGTTPVTAVEQPVRLMLDRSRGLVLGGNIAPAASALTTSSIDNSGGASSTFSAGVFSITVGSSTPSYPRARISVPGLTVGKTYRVRGTSAITGTIAGFLIRLATSGSANNIAAAATTSFDGLAVCAVTDVIEISPTGTGATGTITISSLTVEELPGNHATAPNDASRPVLRSRYNLLERSEEFDNAYWSKTRTSISANVGVAPDGTTTADKLIENTDTNTHTLFPNSALTLATTTSYTYSIYAKAAERTIIHLANNDLVGAFFNLSDGTVSDIAAGFTASITAAGSGWYRCVLTQALNSNASGRLVVRLVSTGTTTSYTGDGTSGILIWGAQLLTAADQTATGGAYQRIAAATDYDTSNPVFRPYLAFDGSDDHMVLASAINITTDMTVVRGFGRSAAGIFSLGLGALTTSTYDALWFTDNRIYQSLTNDLTNFNTAPNTTLGAMVTTSRRSAATETTRLNGTQVNTRAAATVGQSFAYIGLRTTNYNNGPIYGLIVLDRELTGSELTATEQWMAGKTGATLA